MGFRDDRDAVAHRAVALERELGDAHSELRNEKLRSAEVDDLRKRLSEATKERDDLRRGVAPWRTRAGIVAFVLSALLIAVGVVAYMHAQASEHQARRDREEAERALNQVGALRLQLADAATALQQAEAERMNAQHDERSLEDQLHAAERERAGDVLIVAARSNAGEDCFLTVRPLDGTNCLATLTCRGRVVYPLAGDPTEAVCHAPDGEPPWASVHAPLLGLTAGDRHNGLSVDGDGIRIMRNRRVDMMLRRLSAGALSLH